MTTQVNLDLIWAGTGGVTDPGDIKYVAGWGSEIPTYQNFNFILQNHSKNLLVMAESGKFNWEAAINYVVGGSVMEGTTRYTCILDHINQQPSLDTLGNYWTKGDMYGDTTNITYNQGLSLIELDGRAVATAWDGNDITIHNKNCVIYLGTNTTGTNLLFGNIQGELRVVDVGGGSSQILPDGRVISSTDPASWAIFHEGNPPVQSEISGTIPDAPADGQDYTRNTNSWVPVTHQTVATGAEVNTGISDVTAISPKAFKDSWLSPKITNIKLNAPTLIPKNTTVNIPWAVSIGGSLFDELYMYQAGDNTRLLLDDGIDLFQASAHLEFTASTNTGMLTATLRTITNYTGNIPIKSSLGNTGGVSQLCSLNISAASMYKTNGAGNELLLQVTNTYDVDITISNAQIVVVAIR